MASRRRFLQFSLGACAAFGHTYGQSRVPPYYKAIFDERFPAPCAFAAGATERRIPTAPIRWDITRLFFDDLDLRWKQGPVLLAGFTTPASLFCLDLLARDRGMRLSHCEAQPSVERALAVLDADPPQRSMTTPLPSGGPSLLVFWIIRPNTRAATHQHI
jgi:hypothetical protein